MARDRARFYHARSSCFVSRDKLLPQSRGDRERRHDRSQPFHRAIPSSVLVVTPCFRAPWSLSGQERPRIIQMRAEEPGVESKCRADYVYFIGVKILQQHASDFWTEDGNITKCTWQPTAMWSCDRGIFMVVKINWFGRGRAATTFERKRFEFFGFGSVSFPPIRVLQNFP